MCLFYEKKVSKQVQKRRDSSSDGSRGRTHTHPGTEGFGQPLHSFHQPAQCWCTAQPYGQSLGDGQLPLVPPQV